MAVGEVSIDFLIVPGVRLATIPCGIKADNTPDLVLFEFAQGSVTAGIFTQSHFAAAPVIIGKRHLESRDSRFFLINSGNANAATGEQGIADAEGCCKALSQATGTKPEEIIPFSTGVIGERLQVEQITNALQPLHDGLSEGGWLDAAHGIMTTDTCPKIASRRFKLDGSMITITGIAKGSGMIQPNMATMLSYMATDAKCSRDFLQQVLQSGADQSFNRITVDSDTSTNDSCMLTATGASNVEVSNDINAAEFSGQLNSLMQELAHDIVRDGEGATKFVTVIARGGRSEADCLGVAYSIANSPLVKTALFASDANWGRIVMAIGKAEAELDASKIDIYLGDVQVMKNGGKADSYSEQAGAVVMAGEEITITVDLNLGVEIATVWTSDLSHDYISINADYRS